MGAQPAYTVQVHALPVVAALTLLRLADGVRGCTGMSVCLHLSMFCLWLGPPLALGEIKTLNHSGRQMACKWLRQQRLMCTSQRMSTVGPVLGQGRRK